MAYNLKYNNGMIADPISFGDISGLNAENVAMLMAQKAEEMGVPARITTDTVKEGGMFGKSYPCVVIHHPNPPQQYFTDVYIINGDVVNFYFFGESTANTAVNKANARKNSLSGIIINSIAGSKEMELQQEMFWHRKILGIFEGLCN